MLKDNPFVKRWFESGEERMGQFVQQLLSNQSFISAIQGFISRSLIAKETWDKTLRTALSAMNLPSTQDLELLRTKVEDLERILSSIEEKLGKKS